MHEQLPAKAARTWALVKKEMRQILRDPGSIAVGIVLPLVLILLFGYGLSLDVKNVPVAVVLEDTSPDAAELASAFQLSPYFHARLVTSMAQARGLMLDREVDGIIRIPTGLLAALEQRKRHRANRGSRCAMPIARGSSRAMPTGRSASGLRASWLRDKR